MSVSSEHVTHQNVVEQLGRARADVREHPADVQARQRLWQWLAVDGQWDRAIAQCDIVAQLLGSSTPALNLYKHAMVAEQVRASVMTGERAHRLPEDSPAWMSGLAEALSCDARQQPGRGQSMRIDALEQAPAQPGYVQYEGQAAQVAFDWLGDGDCRLGPVCELLVQGHYRWIPFASIASWQQGRPQGLTDILWTMTAFELRDGSTFSALVPARYPLPSLFGVTVSDAMKMSRLTSWRTMGADLFVGVGQRMWLSDQGEYAMLDVRRVQFDAQAVG